MHPPSHAATQLATQVKPFGFELVAGVQVLYPSARFGSMCCFHSAAPSAGLMFDWPGSFGLFIHKHTRTQKNIISDRMRSGKQEGKEGALTRSCRE